MALVFHHLAFPAASSAGCCCRENPECSPLGPGDIAAAAAFVAGYYVRAVLCACAIAVLALLKPWDYYLLCSAKGSFLKLDFHVISQVSPALLSLPPPIASEK